MNTDIGASPMGEIFSPGAHGSIEKESGDVEFYKATNRLSCEVLIYAKDEKKAFEIYKKKICSTEKFLKESFLVIDIKEVVHTMLEEGIPDSRYLSNILRIQKAAVVALKTNNGWIKGNMI